VTIRTAVLTSLVAIAAFSVEACGGDDDKGPSQEEFIAQADRICQAADGKQAALTGTKGDKGIYGPNFSDAAFLSRYNAVTRNAQKQLGVLDVSDADRKGFDDFLKALGASIAAVDKQIAALRARDLPGQSQANRDFQASYGNIASSAGAVGLTRCQALGN
jgi:hypothetical protein